MPKERKSDFIEHTLPPVFDARSRILVLGTMPSPKSRELGFYYGHPQNRFWRVISAVLERDLPETNEAKIQLLLENRIALWDVLQSCHISGAQDGSIRSPVANDFSEIFSGADIRAVFTTGSAAARLYQKLCREKTGMEAVSLPSTSAANCGRYPLERLIEAYGVMKKYL